MYKIGIDLGGTKIEGILLDEKLQVLDRKRIPTNQENGYKSILESITNLVRNLQSKSQKDTSIGVCTPGIIEQETGLIKNSNTQCLIGKPLKSDLEGSLQKPVNMENDANCFTMAESIMGAAKNFSIVFGVIIGTGVGGGIVINGNLHIGKNHLAGEWGHHTIHPEGNSCYCGRNGCVETYISGPALERRWTELTGKKERIPIIIESLDSMPANQWKNEFLENFGLGLANVINILDPDVVVLGGGLSNISFLYEEGKKSVYSNVFSNMVDTPIIKNQLGDSAGVFGASLLEQ